MEKVGNLKDIKNNLCISIKGKSLALFKINEKIYCIDNECTHTGGPLCEGKLEGDEVICPWHASRFNVKTGKVVEGPAIKDIKTYRTTIKNDEVWVDI